VIGLQPTPKAVEQQIERMHKAGASYSHIVNTSTDNLYGTFMFYPKPSDTNWVLSASQSTVSSRNTVTLTAMVTADPHVPAVPTGTVTFYDGCTVLGTANVNTATGAVSLTATLPAISGPQTTGQHTIQAIYGGDMNFFHNNSNQVVVMVQ
jgi:hypothetical protein